MIIKYISEKLLATHRLRVYFIISLYLTNLGEIHIQFLISFQFNYNSGKVIGKSGNSLSFMFVAEER